MFFEEVVDFYEYLCQEEVESRALDGGMDMNAIDLVDAEGMERVF